MFTKHKKDCLSINDAQSVRLEKRTIKFKNYFKKIPVPFKIYADFECNLEGVEIYEDSYSKKYESHVSCCFSYKLVCIDVIAIFRDENVAYKFIQVILEEHEYCKKVMKKYFNKNLILSGVEEQQFQSSNICWICEKPSDDGD